MVLDQRRCTGEAAAVVAPVPHDIKSALRELRGSAPDSILVRLAEQKIERIEQGHWMGQDVQDPDLKVVVARRD